MIGFLAKSLSGHDKDKVYVIINEENDYVLVADGDIRPLEKPKKKNKKHIQIIKQSKIENIESVTNEIVKRTIKLFIKDIQEVK